MKVLVFIAHPGLNEPLYGAVSRINKAFFNVLQEQANITVVDVSKNYNILEYQKLMLEHDRIVLQFPIFWYNISYLAKKWLDDILVHNWAYGREFKLEGKEFMLGLTSGQPTDSYTKTGRIGLTIEELFVSIKITTTYCKMKYLPHFHIGDALHTTDSVLEEASKKYLAHITAVH